MGFLLVLVHSLSVTTGAHPEKAFCLPGWLDRRRHGHRRPGAPHGKGAKRGSGARNGVAGRHKAGPVTLWGGLQASNSTQEAGGGRAGHPGQAAHLCSSR